MADRSFHESNENHDDRAFAHALTRATGHTHDSSRVRLNTSEEQMADSVDTAHLLHAQKMRINEREDFIRARRARQSEGSQ